MVHWRSSWCTRDRVLLFFFSVGDFFSVSMFSLGKTPSGSMYIKWRPDNKEVLSFSLWNLFIFLCYDRTPFSLYVVSPIQFMVNVASYSMPVWMWPKKFGWHGEMNQIHTHAAPISYFFFYFFPYLVFSSPLLSSFHPSALQLTLSSSCWDLLSKHLSAIALFVPCPLCPCKWYVSYHSPVRPIHLPPVLTRHV